MAVCASGGVSPNTGRGEPSSRGVWARCAPHKRGHADEGRQESTGYGSGRDAAHDHGLVALHSEHTSSY